jgi:predicted nucleic-acid-binding protein
MLGIDTNVVIRLIISDDAEQAKKFTSMCRALGILAYAAPRFSHFLDRFGT